MSYHEKFLYDKERTLYLLLYCVMIVYSILNFFKLAELVNTITDKELVYVPLLIFNLIIAICFILLTITILINKKNLNKYIIFGHVISLVLLFTLIAKTYFYCINWFINHTIEFNTTEAERVLFYIITCILIVHRRLTYIKKKD